MKSKRIELKESDNNDQHEPAQRRRRIDPANLPPPPNQVVDLTGLTIPIVQPIEFIWTSDNLTDTAIDEALRYTLPPKSTLRPFDSQNGTHSLLTHFSALCLKQLMSSR